MPSKLLHLLQKNCWSESCRQQIEIVVEDRNVVLEARRLETVASMDPSTHQAAHQQRGGRQCNKCNCSLSKRSHSPVSLALFHPSAPCCIRCRLKDRSEKTVTQNQYSMLTMTRLVRCLAPAAGPALRSKVRSGCGCSLLCGWRARSAARSRMRTRLYLRTDAPSSSMLRAPHAGAALAAPFPAQHEHRSVCLLYTSPSPRD